MRPYNPRYNGKPIIEIIDNNIPAAEHDFLVYVMGPYTVFNAEYAYDDADELKSRYIQDPLFCPEKHIVGGMSEYESALSDLCDQIRAEIGVRPFIATDIDIPTKSEVDDNDLSEPGMGILDQSVEFASVSNAVIFIYSAAGLNAGVGAEAGAILGEFNLRTRSEENKKKPRLRFRIFHSEDFSSGSIDEIPHSYGIDNLGFSSEEELIGQIKAYLVTVQRLRQEKDAFPIFM